jgi:N-acetylneuraminic acid mutarotase
MLFTVSVLSVLALLPTAKAGPSFNKLEPITTARRSAAGGVLDNLNDGSPEAWVTGGSSSESQGPLDLVEVYSLSWGDWRQEASMLQARSHHGAASLNGNLYVGGGITNCGDSHCQTEKVEKYSPSTKTWSQVSPMCKARRGLAFAADNDSGLLYAAGGMDCMEDCSGIPVEYLSTFESYDPVTDTWTSLPPMPTPRTDLSLAIIDSKVYAVGGCGGDGNVQNAKSCDPLSTVEVYDPSTQTWSSTDNLLVPRHGFNLAVYGSQLIAAGGSSSVGIDTASVAKNLTKTVDVCNLSYGTSWSPIAMMTEPREGLVTGNLLVGISMLLITGEGADTTFTDTNEYLALMCSPAPPPRKSGLDKFIHGMSC